MDAVKKLCEEIDNYLEETKISNFESELVLLQYNAAFANEKYEHISAHVLASRLQASLKDENEIIHMLNITKNLITKYIINQIPYEYEKKIIGIDLLFFEFETLNISIKDALEILKVYMELLYLPFIESLSEYYTNFVGAVLEGVHSQSKEELTEEDRVDILEFFAENGYEKIEKYELGDSSLTKEDVQTIVKIKDFVQRNVMETESYKISYCYTSLKNRLIHKQQQDELDIRVIVDCLLKLDCNQSLVEGIKTVLEKRLQKEKQTSQYEALTDSKTTPAVRTKEERTLGSTREERMLQKELSTYFDFEFMKPKRWLTLQEQIYCVSLLLQLKRYDMIPSFLAKIQQANKKENIVGYFATMYPKLKQYAEKYKLDVITMIGYLQEAILTENEDEYLVYKEFLIQDIYNLPKEAIEDYSYEIEEAKKLEFSNRKETVKK